MQNENNIFEPFKIITEKNLTKFKAAGVWALFGKEKANPKPYICLNVGKSANIKDKLQIDFQRLKKPKKPKEKKYINQFSESKFSYIEYPSRLDWLYNEIANKYKDLNFILITDTNDYDIEKYFAYSLKAAYWVSNGRYSEKHETITDDEIQNILKDTQKNIDNKVLEKINKFKKNYLQYVKTHCT